MKTTMGLVIAILIISILTLFWPDSLEEQSNSSTVVSSVSDNATKTVPAMTAKSEPTGPEQRAEQMKSEYELLEQARKDLKRLLARLKHEMWGMKFAPEQAMEINEVMLNAHKFEKTPRMLGAFHDADEIRDERDKVLFAVKSLEEIETWLQQNSGEPGGKS